MKCISRLLLYVSLCAPVLVAQQRLAEVHVEGNANLPAAGIVAASGLQIGQSVTPKDLDAAAQRLVDTGFFRSANYRFASKPGKSGPEYSVTLDVAEDPVRTTVVLDLPGQDQSAIFQQLSKEGSLLSNQMPDNDAAQAYYQRELEAFLKKSGHPQSLTVKREVDLRTRKLAVVFHPAHAASVARVDFRGNQAIESAVLEKKIHAIVVGQDYSERDFRQILELNLVPLYEEKAYLQAKFTKIEAGDLEPGKVSVSATVEEGHTWKLGQVNVTGNALPTQQMMAGAGFESGQLANWKNILQSIDKMNRVLKSDGYLRASAKPARVFHDDSGVVDLQVEFNKGRQFMFGDLQLVGLNGADQQMASKLWTLQSGQPLNEPYIDDYVRAVAKSLAGRVKSFGRELKPRPSGNVMDVVLKFNP